MLDLNQVALFVEVVRAASFAAAARRLGMPANTVSRHVQQLEEGLGCRLLHRSTRKLTLTAAGQAFFDRCSQAVGDITQAGQELADGNQLPAGLIRVAAPADFINAFSMGWIADFMEAHPHVGIEFVLSDTRADLVGEGIDVAFRASHLEDTTNVARKLFANHFILVAAPSYLHVRGTPDDAAALASHDCLTQRSNSRRIGPVVWRLQGPQGLDEVTVSGRFAANTAGAVLQAALTGLGIALLPALVAGPHLRTGRLVHVLPEHRREGGGMQVVMPSRRQVPRAVAAFVDFAARRVAWDWQDQEVAGTTIL